MQTDSTEVALLACTDYDFRELSDYIDNLFKATAFRVSRGSRVLLKPNLLSGRSADHLACTHPMFVAATAAWFCEQGARVAIGDSPAFGTARGVMRATGIAEAVAKLPITSLNFDQTDTVRLSETLTVRVARAALECDLLINLPRVKAHSQLYMTLATKNYFGAVAGLQKPCWHLRYGNDADEFAANLVDLMLALPAGFSLIDGIIAMHETGPVSGRPYPLGLIGGSANPVALDTAVLKTLKLEPAQSPVWRECARRGLKGSAPDQLDYPLLRPGEFTIKDFRAPPYLKSVSFNPLRMLISTCRRLVVQAKE